MKIQYRHQKFQADAAKAVVDVFSGQPYLIPTYMMDRGNAPIRSASMKNGTSSVSVIIKSYRNFPTGKYWNS